MKSKLDEHGLGATTELREIEPEGEADPARPVPARVRADGALDPGLVAVVVETPAGRILHTGDCKLDHTPVDGLKTDVGTLAELGNRGVDLMLGDSTNAERPGMTGSERLVGEAFRQIIPLRTGRILVASFASNIHRDAAGGRRRDRERPQGRRRRALDAEEPQHRAQPRLHGRCPTSRSSARRSSRTCRRDEVLVLCTGSQGEPMSALTRIAYNDHANVSVERGDTVIISAKPVPGNELRVHDSINHLARPAPRCCTRRSRRCTSPATGARRSSARCSRSSAREAVMPIHGEYRMLAAHAQLARDAGVPGEAIVIAENGSVVELTPDGVRIVDRVEAGVTFVDGLGVGDVGDVALRDRRQALRGRRADRRRDARARDGGATIAPPELIARGFGEDAELVEELREEASRVPTSCLRTTSPRSSSLQEHLHDAIAQLVYDRTRRRPMILPVVIEV